MSGVNFSKRTILKDLLSLCTEDQRYRFAQMYASEKYRKDPDDFMYNLRNLAKNNMDIIIDKIHATRLSWAIAQVKNTLGIAL